MNDKQKFMAIAAGALVIGAILAFALKGTSPAQPPAAPPQQQQAELPSGHPNVGEQGGQPAAPAKPIDMKAVVGKIDGFLNQQFPGDWKVEGDKLSKGDYTENGNYKIADQLETQLGSGSMISIFVGEKRISTNVKQGGTERALDYPVPAQVAEVMKNGKQIDAGASSMGSMSFQKTYLPLKDKDGKTIGVMSVSVSQ